MTGEISRRGVVAAASAVALGGAAEGSVFVTGPKPGINIGALAFDVYSPWGARAEIPLWRRWMTPQRWSDLTRAGFSHIRLAIDPTPMLRTSGRPDELAPFLGRIGEATDDVLAHGMKCIIDMHVSPDDPQYGDHALMAAAAAQSPVWDKARVVWRAVGAIAKTYSPQRVAYEIYNETDQQTHQVYAPAIRDLCAAVRQVNTSTKLLVAPCRWCSGYSVPGFTRAMYASFAPIGFVHHYYNPHIFASQGLNEVRYFQRVEFPPQPAAMSRNLAVALAGISADPKLSPAARAAAERTVREQLAAYYSGRFDTQADGLTRANAIDMGDRSGQSQGRGVYAWQRANGVAGSDVHITEFGVHRDYERTGAGLDDAARWFAQASKSFDARGYNRTVWCEDDTYWSLRRAAGSSGRFRPTGPFEPALLSAIGL